MEGVSCFLFYCFLGFFLPLTILAKNYSIQEVRIQAKLNSQGTMQVEETRTWQFDGEFSYAYQTIPKHPDVTYQDFSVSMEGETLRRSESKTPHTFRVNKTHDQIRIKWFFEATDESKTFTVSYEVNNAVKSYQDGAYLEYRFIGNKWEVPQENITISLIPPRTIKNRDSILHKTKGSEDIELTEFNEGTFTWELQKLGEKDFIEIDILYPKGLSPEAMKVDKSINENFDAPKREERESGLKNWEIVILTIFLALLISWIWLFLSNKNNLFLFSPRPAKRNELPSDDHPALINFLLYNRSITTPALTASLVHLGQKGILNFHAYELPSKKKPEERFDFRIELNREEWQNQHKSLTSFDNFLLESLFDNHGQSSNTIYWQEVNDSKVSASLFLEQWLNQVKNEGQRKNWFNPSIDKIKKSLYIITGFTLLAGIIATAIVKFAVVALILVGFGQFFLTSRLKSLTSEGRSKFLEWEAFHRYLNEKRFEKDPPTIAGNQYGNFLKYSIALDIKKKSLEKLSEFIIDREGHPPLWLHNDQVEKGLAELVPLFVLQTCKTGKLSRNFGSRGHFFPAYIGGIYGGGGAAGGVGAGGAPGGGGGGAG